MPRLKINTTVISGMPSLFDMPVMDHRIKPRPTLRFISFGSGSSGNCSYIGDGETGILIDAGVSPDKVVPELKRRGISMSTVRGILITHDHSDHIRFVYKLLKKHPHMALFATPKTLGGVFRRHSLSPRLKDYHRPIYIETPFRAGGFTVTAFQTPHDGTDNVGFFIESGELKFAVATDLGSVTERVDHYMRQANFIMIEANYDSAMLRNGRYPMHLKARIAADNGHLDNVVTARYLAGMWTPKLSHIFLCHLSHDNNMPEIALAAVRNELEGAGVKVGDASGSIEAREADVQLTALPRFDASTFFILSSSATQEATPVRH